MCEYCMSSIFQCLKDKNQTSRNRKIKHFNIKYSKDICEYTYVVYLYLYLYLCLYMYKDKYVYK